MNRRVYLELVKETASSWLSDRAPTMGAALAFYSAFALAPLLVIAIALAGALFGKIAPPATIVAAMADVVGAPAAEAVQALLAAAQDVPSGVIATLIGFVTMLIGATTIVVELQDDLDHIWKAPKRSESGWLTMLRARTLSLVLIIATGLVLLASIVLNGGLAAVGLYSESYLPGATVALLRFSSLVFSLGVPTVLFAMLYKFLPNVSIAWRDVWTGAFITAVLFDAGRLVIGLYLGRSALASAYGAAGTLVVLLLWLYYSAQIFLFGAEFTCVHAKCRLTTGLSSAVRFGEHRGSSVA